MSCEPCGWLILRVNFLNFLRILGELLGMVEMGHKNTMCEDVMGHSFWCFFSDKMNGTRMHLDVYGFTSRNIFYNLVLGEVYCFMLRTFIRSVPATKKLPPVVRRDTSSAACP